MTWILCRSQNWIPKRTPISILNAALLSSRAHVMLAWGSETAGFVLPGKPPASNHGLLWGIVAYNFELFQLVDRKCGQFSINYGLLWGIAAIFWAT